MTASCCPCISSKTHPGEAVQRLNRLCIRFQGTCHELLLLLDVSEYIIPWGTEASIREGLHYNSCWNITALGQLRLKYGQHRKATGSVYFNVFSFMDELCTFGTFIVLLSQLINMEHLWALILGLSLSQVKLIRIFINLVTYKVHHLCAPSHDALQCNYWTWAHCDIDTEIMHNAALQWMSPCHATDCKWVEKKELTSRR